MNVGGDIRNIDEESILCKMSKSPSPVNNISVREKVLEHEELIGVGRCAYGTTGEHVICIRREYLDCRVDVSSGTDRVAYDVGLRVSACFEIDLH